MNWVHFHCGAHRRNDRQQSSHCLQLLQQHCAMALRRARVHCHHCRIRALSLAWLAAKAIKIHDKSFEAKCEMQRMDASNDVEVR